LVPGGTAIFQGRGLRNSATGWKDTFVRAPGDGTKLNSRQLDKVSDELERGEVAGGPPPRGRKNAQGVGKKPKYTAKGRGKSGRKESADKKVKQINTRRKK